MENVFSGKLYGGRTFAKVIYTVLHNAAFFFFPRVPAACRRAPTFSNRANCVCFPRSGAEIPPRTQFRSLANLRNRIKQARKSVSRCHDGKSMTPGGVRGPIYVRRRTIFVNFATNGSRRSGVSCYLKRRLRLDVVRVYHSSGAPRTFPRYFRASNRKAELSRVPCVQTHPEKKKVKRYQRRERKEGRTITCQKELHRGLPR